MPSHQDRVRKNYECPSCGGTGKQDDYEGEYTCSTCDGAGIVLRQIPPPRPPSPIERALIGLVTPSLIERIDRNAALVSKVNREYDENFESGDVIKIMTTARFKLASED